MSGGFESFVLIFVLSFVLFICIIKCVSIKLCVVVMSCPADPLLCLCFVRVFVSDLVWTVSALLCCVKETYGFALICPTFGPDMSEFQFWFCVYFDGLLNMPWTSEKLQSYTYLVAHDRVVTSSRQITEVAQNRARFVLWWVTGAQVMLPAMCWASLSYHAASVHPAVMDMRTIVVSCGVMHSAASSYMQQCIWSLVRAPCSS